MNRRDFLKTTVAGTGLGALPGGIWGLGGPASGQQPPAAAEPRRADMTLRRAAGDRMLIGAAIGARSLDRRELTSLLATTDLVNFERRH